MLPVYSVRYVPGCTVTHEIYPTMLQVTGGPESAQSSSLLFPPRPPEGGRGLG